jgi:hypothetical protein
MTIPTQTNLTITDGPGYREARWRPPYLKPVIGVIVVIVLMTLGSMAFVYTRLVQSSAATHTNPVTTFLPMAAIQLLVLAVFITIFLRRVITPHWLRLHDDRLEIRTMTTLADGTAARGQVITLPRGDIRDVRLSSEQMPHLEADTPQGTVHFAYMLPPSDLATLAQMIGQWLRR